MTTSNFIKLIICLAFIFAGVLIWWLGDQALFGIAGIAIGIIVALTTFRS